TLARRSTHLFARRAFGQLFFVLQASICDESSCSSRLFAAIPSVFIRLHPWLELLRLCASALDSIRVHPWLGSTPHPGPLRVRGRKGRILLPRPRYAIRK